MSSRSGCWSSARSSCSPRAGSPEPVSVAIVAAGYLTLLWRRSRPVIAGAVMFSMWILLNLGPDEVKSIQMPLIGALFMGYAMGAFTQGRDARLAPLVIVAGVTGVTATWRGPGLHRLHLPDRLRAARLARRARRTNSHAAHRGTARGGGAGAGGARGGGRPRGGGRAAPDRARDARRGRSQRLGDGRAGGRRPPHPRPRPARGRSTPRYTSRRSGGRRWPRCAGCSASCTTRKSARRSRAGRARRAGRAHARRRAAGLAERRGRAALAPRRHGPRRLPRGAGGSDERDQARRRGADRGDRALGARAPGARDRRQRRPRPPTASAGGHGLVGMEERVRLYDGALRAGRRQRRRVRGRR